MNNDEFKKLDSLLNELKDGTHMKQDTFKAEAEFKKDFFEKAEAMPPKPVRFPVFARITAAAAALAVVSFVVTWSAQPDAKQVETAYVPEASRDIPAVPAAPGDFSEEQLNAAELPLPEEFAEEIIEAPAAAFAEADFAPAIKMNMGFGSAGDKSLGLSLARKKVKKEAVRSAEFNTEEYKQVTERNFMRAAEQPVSTFGADVDTAGYANARRYLLDYQELPPRDAVRVEEFINYFHYDYAKPQGNEKFAVTFEMDACPWQPEHKLLLVGLQAKMPPKDQLPPSNFVFLIDNSGSMSNSMPLVIGAMSMLANQLRPQDSVSIVTYGGGVNTLLDGVRGSEKELILEKIKVLQSGGYTPGSDGIQTAYKLAHKHFLKNGNNRIILITDGDFNVGTSSESELVAMVEKERQSAIYLTVLGCGMGNYKDNKVKMLANKGNGNYAYLDSAREAKRVLETEFAGGMFTLAKDVKLQLEFNPAQVAAYRLVGYELRHLENRDFRDDTKDAGEVGMGHQVTALYELVMADAPQAVKDKVIPPQTESKSKYQTVTPSKENSGEMLTFRLRYQEPEGNAPAAEKEFVLNSGDAKAKATANFQWASAAAEFAMLLRNSEHKGNASFKNVQKRAVQNIGKDESGERAEFLIMLRNASEMTKK